MPGSTTWSRAEFKPSSAHPTQLHNTQDALHLLRAKLSFPALGPASEQQELNRGPQEAPQNKGQPRNPLPTGKKNSGSSLTLSVPSEGKRLTTARTCVRGVDARPTFTANTASFAGGWIPDNSPSLPHNADCQDYVRSSPAKVQLSATSIKNNMGLLEAGPGHSSAAPRQPQRCISGRRITDWGVPETSCSATL